MGSIKKNYYRLIWEIIILQTAFTLQEKGDIHVISKSHAQARKFEKIHGLIFYTIIHSILAIWQKKTIVSNIWMEIIFK